MHASARDSLTPIAELPRYIPHVVRPPMSSRRRKTREAETAEKEPREKGPSESGNPREDKANRVGDTLSPRTS